VAYEGKLLKWFADPGTGFMKAVDSAPGSRELRESGRGRKLEFWGTAGSQRKARISVRTGEGEKAKPWPTVSQEHI
jgi:hypothetical protein